MTSPTTRTRALDVSGAFTASGLPLCLSPYRVILQALRAQRRRVVEVAAVEHGGRLQRLLDRREVRAAELLPFGDDGERVGAFERLAGIRQDGHRPIFREKVA